MSAARAAKDPLDRLVDLVAEAVIKLEQAERELKDQAQLMLRLGDAVGYELETHKLGGGKMSAEWVPKSKLVRL